MTLVSTIIVLFIFLLASLLVIRPFLVESDDQKGDGSGSYDSMLAEKERLYGSIEDLDRDLELEKISLEEHAKEREDLLRQAAMVLKELDAHPYSTQSKVSVEALPDDDKLEKMIAERRKKIQESQMVICPTCGQSVAEGDKFCSHCGGKL